ncbi:Conserved_hypothetical protein [Hexamita inflata]|uniref:ISXO2-like transposase domain-containing protein n=1 Tax=Hexamita inflata TaxID=28002 RepID=A0AA86QKA8_9EUKA|nr:Conserved hypothetical protein [Hexamita inflata]
MEAFKPTLLDNISFYAKFKKFNRAPPLPKQCTKCFHPVKLVGNIFICINTNCKKRHDLWAGTPLAGFHSMQWDRHFQLIVECASNSTAASAAAKYFVNERTVDRVFDQFREYCQKYLERIQFYDGEDKEIDEFVGARVKYHRGEPTKGTTKWFFSIRGRQSRIFRCFYILGRSIEEVQPLINKYCKIGDTVYSDGLATYKHLSSTFVHKSVNHSEHFADPEDPTNNINGLEGSHGALRKKLAFMVQFKQIKSNSTSISIAFRDNLVMIPYNSWIMCGLHLMNENKKYFIIITVFQQHFNFNFKIPNQIILICRQAGRTIFKSCKLKHILYNLYTTEGKTGYVKINVFLSHPLMIHIINNILSQTLFSQLQYRQLLLNNNKYSNSMQICSSKLVDRQQIQYCLKAVSLSSLTQASQVVNSPAQEVFHSLYTEKTQDLKIDMIYSMKNLPSFALFGLTKSIEIFDSNLSVKVPQPLSKSAMICFQCDIHSSVSEFVFVAQAQIISGLVYCPYTIMVLNSSLIQFRLTGLNVGGLIFQAINIQVQISLCNISGYVSNGSFSGILIATVTNSSTIEVQNVIICVQFNDIISDNQIGSGVDGVQISGNLIKSCDLCGSFYFAYGLCLDNLNFGEVVNDILICLHSFVFDGEGCSCPDGLQIQGYQCVNILEIIESQENQIKSLENTSSLMQNQIQKLQNRLNNLTQYLECVNKKGYQYVNGSCIQQAIDFMQCLTADKYISTFDISSITNLVSQSDFSNGNSVFKSQYFIQNAFINVKDGTYSSVAIPLFESQQQFSNIKIQIGTQSIETGSILTVSENITVNQMKIVSREQSTLAVTSYLNILITSSVSSTINNFQLNLAFEVQNGNITLIDHVTGTLNISGYQVLGVIQSLQIVAMIGINVEQAVLILQNINYNPTVHNAGNLSSYLFSNVITSKIQVDYIFIKVGNINQYSKFGQLSTNSYQLYYLFGGIIAYSNNSDLTLNSIIFDSYIEFSGAVIIVNSGFIVGYSQSAESSINLNNLCLHLTLTSFDQIIRDFGYIGTNEGNISLNKMILSQVVVGYIIDGFGVIGCQDQTSIQSKLNQISVIAKLTLNQTEKMSEGTNSILIGKLNSLYNELLDISILNSSFDIKKRNSIGVLVGWAENGLENLNQIYISIINTIINCSFVTEDSIAGYIYNGYLSKINIFNSIFTCNQSGYICFGGFISDQQNCNTTISNSQFTNSTIQNTVQFVAFIQNTWNSNTTIVDSSFSNSNILNYELNEFYGGIAGFIAQQQTSNTTLQRLLINKVNIEGITMRIGGFVYYSLESDSLISDSVIQNSNISGPMNIEYYPPQVGVFYDTCYKSNLTVTNSNITNVNLSGEKIGIYYVKSEPETGTVSISNCFTKNVSINGVLQEDTEYQK